MNQTEICLTACSLYLNTRFHWKPFISFRD